MSIYKNPEIYKKNVMPIKGKKRQQFYFADGSDSLFNQGFKFSIQHVPSGQKIEFKAFITAFNDSYSQDWNSEPVYGRADPLYNFKQTTRKISFAFKMPAVSEGEAYANLAKAQKLAQFMYPNYTDVNGAKVLSQAPLLRLKIMNLLQVPTGPSGNTNDGISLYDGYGTGGEGVLGWFSDVTFTYNLENSDNGVFQKLNSDGSRAPGTILPKTIDVSIGGFNPIHEQLLGWQVEYEKGKDNKDTDKIKRVYFGEGKSFPYGAEETDSASPDPSLKAGHQFVGWSAKHKLKVAASFSLTEQQKLEKAKAEAAIANAEARYAGLGGNLRRKRDEKKLAGGKYKSESKAAYIASALGGQGAIEAGFADDGSLSSDEVWATNSMTDLYDGYVGE